MAKPKLHKTKYEQKKNNGPAHHSAAVSANDKKTSGPHSLEYGPDDISRSACTTPPSPPTASRRPKPYTALPEQDTWPEQPY